MHVKLYFLYKTIQAREIESSLYISNVRYILWQVQN